MKRPDDRFLAGAALVLLVFAGIGLLAFLVLTPNFAQSRLDGPQPVSLLSGRQANYSIDPSGILVQPLDMKVVAQVIADRTTSTMPAGQQAATKINDLKTPVYTVTAYPGTANPTQSGRQYTITALAFTSTPGVSQASLTPRASTTGVAQSATPTLPVAPTATFTRVYVTLPPIATVTPFPTPAPTPTHTNTPVPTPPGTTATPTPQPTATPRPTYTPWWTPTLPSTALPTVKPSQTGQAPTATLVPTATPTRTLIPTLPPSTATWTPLPTATWTAKPPTATWTPIPPTNTATPPAYPPPPSATPRPTTVGSPTVVVPTPTLVPYP